MILNDSSITTVITAVILILILYISLKKYKSSKLPPGPLRWPLVGNLLQMSKVATPYPHERLNQLVQKYGPLMSLRFGVNPVTVYVSSYDLIKDLLKHPETNKERFRPQFIQERFNGEHLGIIWGRENWAELRKKTIKGLKEFGLERKALENSVHEEMSWLIKSIESETKKSEGNWKVDQNQLTALVINVVWKSVGGYRFGAEAIRDQIELYKKTAEINSVSQLLNAFPFLKIFPNWSGFNDQKEHYRKSIQFAKGLVDDAKSRRRSSRRTNYTFLESCLEEIESGKNPAMNEPELVGILMDLLLASTETTSAVLNWTILNITLNEGVQERALEEIQALTGNPQGDIRIQDVQHLPYIRACILESMRHAPIVPLPPSRLVTENVDVGKFRIPKGSCVQMFLYPVFHEKSFWRDPEVYSPARFLQNNGTQLDSGKVERVMLQFGTGKRNCFGEQMAMDIMVLVIGMLVQNYSLGLIEGEEAEWKLGSPSMLVLPEPYAIKIINRPRN